jgi:hypothetical protein
MNCADENSEHAAEAIIEQSAERYLVKSKTISSEGIELTAEIRTKDANTDFVNRISSVPGIENATLVSYNGDYMA